MLITPPGTSDVSSASARVIAGSGRSWEASTTTVLPETTIGATTDTRPSREDRCGASAATTPVGSGAEMLKYGPATGLRPPSTWAYLSAQPAYQTHRSTAADTTASARCALRPSAACTSAANCARRPSMTSATR